MRTAQYWIDHLNLLPHPEGGFFRETYRSIEIIPKDGLPESFTGARSFSTAIYFLLTSEDRSMFHRIKSDELWHFHKGSSLTLFVLDEHGLALHKLGDDPEQEESLQVVIRANCWFGAVVNDADSYTLSGCTVAPGFDFQDFEIAERAALLKQFPSFSKVIEMLTPSA